MNTELKIERVKLAENMVAGVQYLSKRSVLDELSTNTPYLTLKTSNPIYDNLDIDWIKIDQVGQCPSFSSKQYFSAIQKALLSCYLPGKAQLIFLVNGDGEKVNIYIGIKQIEEHSILYDSKSNIECIASYINAVIPGTNARFIESHKAINEQLKKGIEEKEFTNLYALTGIPSFSNDGDELFTAIDTIVGPLCKKRFMFYVVAEPIEEYRINSIMTKCLDISGKIESVKSYNISESNNISTSFGSSESISETINNSEAVAVNRKGKKHHFWCKLMSTIGLGDFIDQSTNTITKGLSNSNSQSTSTNESRGFTATTSMNLINKCAEYASDQIYQHAKRYESGLSNGMWETGVYILTEDNYSALSAALQLKSSVTGSKSSLEPIRIHNISQLLKTKDNSQNTRDAIKSFCIQNIILSSVDDDNKNGQIIKSNFEDKIEKLTTILTTEELSCYINLPQKSIPGVSVLDYSSDFSLSPQNFKNNDNILNIGKLVYSGTQSNISVKLPLNTLSRHALVCGVNGSGKTNTVLSILDGFMKEDKPFFVIEPAKTEYVDWAIEYNKRITDPKKKIKIFIPGCERYAKADFKPDRLRINPFEVIDLEGSELRVLSHIDRLKSTFASAFPMQDILPVIMEHLLYELYTDKHPMLDRDDPSYMKKGYPTLDSINREFIDDLMVEIGYAKENTQNISAALRTRFKSLKFGWKGEMMNNDRLKDMSWDELFNTPVVVNLSYAGDDQDRAFIMSLLLQFLYEYRIAESETGKVSFNSNECRHLVVVEEAHRVMGRCQNPESPQYKSGLMFSNFLSEVRAYGQGMMIVDQIPTRLIEDAIKNTNVKIIHKLVASDDSQCLADCIGLTSDQQKVISKLSIGKAVLAGFNSANVVSNNNSDIYLAQINKMK